MAAVSQIIPNMLGGVSQQPDPLKLPGQVRAAENVLIDPTFGCQKRPPTKFINTLASNLPSNIKWFPIFRDNNERYICCVYSENDKARVRVWEAETGTEKTVVMKDTVEDYLNAADMQNISALTINDYTLVANSEQRVQVDTNSSAEQKQEALLIINQVGYNTTYQVDFLKDGDTTKPVKIYRAKALSVSPGSFEVTGDGGACTLSDAQNFNESSGSKTGLGFTVTTRCQPTQVIDYEKAKPYPLTLASSISGPALSQPSFPKRNNALNAWAFNEYGHWNHIPNGTFNYVNHTINTPYGVLQATIELKMVNNKWDAERGESYGGNWEINGTSVVSYTTSSAEWAAGQSFNVGSGSWTWHITVTNVKRGDDIPKYSYKSVYSTSVQLKNGGVGWRKGDKVNVTMKGRNYVVTVSEETFSYGYQAESSVSYTSPADTAAGTLAIGTITAELVTKINALANYTAEAIGNVVYIRRTDDRAFNIQAKGGSTEKAMYALKGSVNDISLLPSQGKSGMILLVRNTVDSEADDYYVAFQSNQGNIPGQGSWIETVKPGIQTDLNPNTMPVALIREATGDFTVRALTSEYDDTLHWAGREVGDEKTNPMPSFVEQGINDMFFYMNRMGILTDDAVVLSQPGDYFNFFQGSAIAVADSDPIDMTAASTRPAILRAAIPTPKGLVIFAQDNQFLMSTQDVAFGPSTAKIVEISTYSYHSQIKPLDTGVSILFDTEADTFSKVFEMAVDSVENRPTVAENTRTIPEYIPPDLTVGATSPNNSIIIYGNGEETLYVFKFFNTGNERQIAGWATWTMPAPVEFFEFYHDTAYFIMDNNGDAVLTKMELYDDPISSPIFGPDGRRFEPRLDLYLTKERIVREDIDTRRSILRFPDNAYVEGTQPVVIANANGLSTLFVRPEIQEDAFGYYVEVLSKFLTGDYTLGLEYTMRVELPSFYVHNDKVPQRAKVPVVEFAYIDLYQSGRYDIITRKQGYDDVLSSLDVTTSDVYHSNTAAIVETSSPSIPVFCRGDLAHLIVEAPDPLPAALTSYTWEGHFSNRGISILR